MVTRDAASVALRKEAAEIMRLHHEGSFTAAMARAVELGLKHGGSALVLNLVGTLHQVAYTACKVMSCRRDAGFAKEGSAEEENHKRAALSAFSAAAWLAPNCVDIAVSHGEMLAENERYEDAYVELVRALGISDPADPAAHDVGCDVYDDETTLAERLGKATVRARHAMERLAVLICEHFIPNESARVLDGIKLGGEAAANARARAKHLATTYTFAPRAHLLRAHVDLELVRGLDPAIDKRRFLHRTLDMIQDTAYEFHRSLVIALFRAKLLFVLDQYDDAECECHRALAIESPFDPVVDDLPPGSVSGAEYDDRVCFVRNQHRTLIKKIIFSAAIYSCTLTSEDEDSLISVRVKPLIQLCNTTDKSSAKTITDAVRFFKGNNSWSFLVCPLSSRCDGRKFVDTSSLWGHLCNKHPDGLWRKLQSVLGSKLSENTSEGNCSLEWITFSQDSEQHDIFRLIKINDMFDSLIRLTAGGTEPDLVEMRTEKCREGAEILEGIKKRLGTLPTDTSSSQGKLKKRMAGDPNIVGHISASKIDPIFDDAPSDRCRNVSVGYDSNLSSDVNKIGAAIRQNLKVCVENGSSGAKVNTPMDVEGIEMEIAEILANMKHNLELEETDGQLAEEMSSTTGNESVDVLNKEITDKDLFILHPIIQSLWNLRYLRDEFLMGKPAWILNISGNCYIADLIYGIFSAWEKNEHDRVAVLLASVKDGLCKIANDNMFQKLQAGKGIASEVVVTVFQGLHISEASLHFCFNNEIEGRVVSPISCRDCICRTHNLFGIMFLVRMSCRCGKSFNEKEHTINVYRLDAGSPQTTKIKSFAELPVLYDQQLCFVENCEYCGNSKKVDVSPLNTPHFFTIGLDWFGGSKNQGQLSELLVGIAHPLDIKLLCKGVHFSANYSLASMIAYADGRYVCFARNQDKWLICDAETVEAADSWELLLERFSDRRLQPEVLFFEVIKGSRAHRKEAVELERRQLEAERALRREAVAALRMYREEGRHDEAIARAEELAAEHPDSALAAHLAALLHHDATNRAVYGPDQPSAAGKHLHPSRDFYIRAARLASNCVEIATSLATVRFACLDDDDADLDIRRAVIILSPTDPAENNVAYDLDDGDGGGGSTTTPKDRIANARAAALERYNLIMSFIMAKVIPRAVRDVLDLAKREGAAKAVKPAKALAARYPYSARALFAHAHVDVEFARGLAAGIDKRPFLDRLLGELNREAQQFDTSLVLAAFRAKLVFLLGSYVAAEGECSRGLHMVGAADPGDEDVPPGSVPGETSEDRESSVRVELGRLFQKIVLATKDYWCSLPREKQDRFRFAGFNSMHRHYTKNYDNTHEAAKTISDAISYFKKNRSWRFWICPYCVGKKIPDTDSLLQHMRNKHPEGGVWPKLLLVLDPKLVDSSESGYFLDDVAVCQDSEENYVLHFKRMDHVFKYLFLRATGTVEHKQFSELRENKCKEGIEILEMMKPKLKNVPADILSTEFNEACAEIQVMWSDFLEISVLDYRVVITPLAIYFISDRLLLSMSNDEKAASKSIDDADIDALFPNVDDTPDIDAIFPKVDNAPSSNAADTSKAVTYVQSGEEMASTISYENEQSCFEDNCEHCGSPKNTAVSPSNTPHFFTIGLDWSGGCENQVELSEVLVGIAHPLDIKLLCKGVHSSANYSLTSMISYADGRYVCFARDQDKWLISDAKTVETKDSWEQLLECFRDCQLQPEVLFFERQQIGPAEGGRGAGAAAARGGESPAQGGGGGAADVPRGGGTPRRGDRAIACAEELAAEHPDSALAAHLAAHLHHHNDATNRAVYGSDQPSAAGKHLHQARDFYIRAARLASNCVEIATRLATVRFSCLDDDDADLDIRRAVTILSPTDPAENNVAYDLDDGDGGGGSTTTPKDRIANARAAALELYNLIMSFIMAKVIPRAVRDVLDLAKREGAAKAVKPAKALAARYPYSARALFAHAHVDVEFARGLAAGIDKRPFLDRLLGELNREAQQFDTSLVLAAFRAKLVFLLGSYVAAEGECSRGLHMVGAADPGDEDVPPGSVPGETSEDRESSVRVELGRLFQKIVLVSKDYWCSLPREKQDRFRFAGFNSMHRHYTKNYDDTHEAAKTISDAISYFKKNRSWRFWICPYCVGKKIPDTNSLLQHMRNKHPEGGVWPKLLSILDPKLVDSSKSDYFLNDVAVCQDSEENYVLHFKRMDHVFKYLFLRATGTIEHEQFSELRENKCKEGIEILEMMKPKLKNVPADILSTEFNEACAEIQGMWCDFLEISVLHYRVVITPLAIYFISDQLLLSMSNDEKAASKSIDAADIDALFPNVDDTPDIDAIFPKDAPSSNASDTSKAVTYVQSGEEMASTISYESIYVLDNDNTDKDLIILHVIIQSCFEDNCEHCGSPKNTDVSPSNTPHFFTIGLDWSGGCENQVELSEVLVGIAHPLDIKLLCKGVHSSANYSLTSMTKDSWEQLLERFRDCQLQPEVLFFEVIK
uniref:C2H2-type domain-containing protein n=1 Tax=Oryza punctata TaxID=4537 RepID=A0A0E0MGX7_ORYPU